MRRLTVVRIRPVSASHEGPDTEHLRSIASALQRALYQTSAGDLEWTENSIADIEFGPKSLSNRGSVAKQIDQKIVDAEDVIIDLSFGIDGSERTQLMLTLSIAQSRMMHRVHHVLFLLHTDSDQTLDAINAAIYASDSLRKSATVVNMRDGAVYALSQSTWRTTLGIGPAAKVNPEHYVERMRRKLVRRRGVFEGVSAGSYFGYWFSLESAWYEIRKALGFYVANNHVDAILLDSNSEEWFVALVRGVANELKVPFVSSDSLQDDDFAWSVFDESTVLILAPMLRTGTILSELVKAVEASADEVCILVLMARANATDTTRTYFIEKDFLFKGEVRHRLVHYFVSVAHDELSREDWRVRSALASGEIEDATEAWSRPSSIAMHSIVAASPLLDTSSIRPGVMGGPQYIPDLRKLAVEDRLWLAESVLRVAEQESDASRGGLVFVLTEDFSGDNIIGGELRNFLNVPTVVIGSTPAERSHLEGFLETYEGYHVVVLHTVVLARSEVSNAKEAVRACNQGTAVTLSISIFEFSRGDEPPIDQFCSLVHLSHF